MKIERSQVILLYQDFDTRKGRREESKKWRRSGRSNGYGIRRSLLEIRDVSVVYPFGRIGNRIVSGKTSVIREVKKGIRV